MQCPKCGSETYEYWYRNKGIFEYSGPSENRCRKCDYREGFFCHQELNGDEVEPIECDGCKHHPKVVEL